MELPSFSGDANLTLNNDKIEASYGEARQFRDRLIGMINEGACSESEITQLNEKCQRWLQTQPNDQVSISHRILPQAHIIEAFAMNT